MAVLELPPPDTDLDRARAAAVRGGTRALADLLQAGLTFPDGVDPDQWAWGFAEAIAKITCPAGIDEAWADLKRAHRPPMEDGR